MNLSLSVVRGVEGLAVYLCDYRIAGPKPWGGGTVIAEWQITMADLRSALALKQKRRKKAA